MTTLPCDIVLLPEPSVNEQALTASQQLADLPSSLFTLKEGAFYPHLSLYLTQIEDTNSDEVARRLQTLTQQCRTISLQATRYNQSAGYIDITYDTNEALLSLQQQVVAAINPLRSGALEFEASRLSKATGVLRENIEKYGYRGIGEMFRPHITLTRFSDPRPVSTDSLPQPTDFGGRFTRLGFFAIGDHGTCIRQIAVFDLLA